MRSSTRRIERRRKHIVTAKVELRNQDDTIMATGEVDVELPVE